jgi:phosphoribosylanthranilate isomerase
MVRVKICGITNWGDARLAVDLGATMLGFIFHPASPRVVSPARAWDIIRRLPSCVVPVGLFVDWRPDVVDALARAIHLKALQLQGDESPADARALRASGHKVIKAFRVGPKFRLPSVTRYRGDWAILLDGFAPGLYGGTGKTVDLKIARRARKYGRVKRSARRRRLPWMFAAGPKRGRGKKILCGCARFFARSNRVKLPNAKRRARARKI